jgi:hypothetical protein
LDPQKNAFSKISDSLSIHFQNFERISKALIDGRIVLNWSCKGKSGEEGGGRRLQGDRKVFVDPRWGRRIDTHLPILEHSAASEATDWRRYAAKTDCDGGLSTSEDSGKSSRGVALVEATDEGAIVEDELGRLSKGVVVVGTTDEGAIVEEDELEEGGWTEATPK